MKLKKLLKVCDEDLSITIHQNGELDRHYAFASAIPYDLLNLEVLRIDTSYTSFTELYVHISLPEDQK